MCGIVAVSGHKHASKLVWLALQHLQHRGEEGFGIVSTDTERLFAIRRKGRVATAFLEAECDQLRGSTAIGHTRYSTTSGESKNNIQPIIGKMDIGEVAIAHNGNLLNHENIKDELMKEGSVFNATSDTEVLLHLIAKQKSDLVMKFSKLHNKTLKGSYALCLLSKDTLIVARDENGIRPLIIGEIDGAKIYASESCAITAIGGKIIEDFEIGVMEFRSTSYYEGSTSSGTIGEPVYIYPPPKRERKICIFEYVYFARPDSVMENIPIYDARIKLGEALAKEHPVEADIVIAVPDSGVPSAIGYSRQSKIPFEVGILRSHYTGRSFIQPTQEIREYTNNIKLHIIESAVKDKRIIVIDDSIVRGTTAKKICKMLKKAGAKEVHFRVSSPPVISPCYYGIDTPTSEELIGANCPHDYIKHYVGCDSLEYLSLKEMKKVIGLNNYCDSCFTGNYII